MVISIASWKSQAVDLFYLIALVQYFAFFEQKNLTSFLDFFSLFIKIPVYEFIWNKFRKTL